MKISNTLPVSSARKKIFAIMKEIKDPKVYYTVTERGIPRAVILSAERFEALMKKKADEIIDFMNLQEIPASAGSLIFDGAEKRYSSKRPVMIPKVTVLRDGPHDHVETLAEEDQRLQEEGYIKSVLFIELIDKYGYPLKLIELGRYVQRKSQVGNKYIEADIIAGNREGDVRVIFEVSGFDTYEKNMDEVVSDLYDIAEAVSWREKPKFLVYYSRTAKAGKVFEKISSIDYEKFPKFALWKKSGRQASKKIPEYPC
ncbi:MAG: type II toxin-antitoxin system Phd/YefM family antitoxin [Candidatus Moranbacteria bacterium]|nr:type II toxin-antitoxin system Phd/YefM family antitoxin [Candidatus Moranbacteria bacterium]